MNPFRSAAYYTPPRHWIVCERGADARRMPVWTAFGPPRLCGQHLRMRVYSPLSPIQAVMKLTRHRIEKLFAHSEASLDVLGIPWHEAERPRPFLEEEPKWNELLLLVFHDCLPEVEAILTTCVLFHSIRLVFDCRWGLLCFACGLFLGAAISEAATKPEP